MSDMYSGPIARLYIRIKMPVKADPRCPKQGTRRAHNHIATVKAELDKTLR